MPLMRKMRINAPAKKAADVGQHLLTTSVPTVGKCRTPKDFHSGGPHLATLTLVACSLGWLKLEFFFFFSIFIWLHWVLVAAHRIFSLC